MSRGVFWCIWSESEVGIMRTESKESCNTDRALLRVLLWIGLLFSRRLRGFSGRLLLECLLSWFCWVGLFWGGSRLLSQCFPKLAAVSCWRRCSLSEVFVFFLRSFLIASLSFFLPGGIMVGSVMPFVCRVMRSLYCSSSNFES